MVFIRMVPVPLVTKCVILYMYVLIMVMANPRYICYFTSHFIHSFSPYPYSFPSLSLIPSPISPSIHFHSPHIPHSPSILFPHFPPSQHFPISPPSFPHSLHPPHNLVQSTYTDLTPSATRFPRIHPHMPLYPRCTLLYPHSHALSLYRHSHIHLTLCST